MVLVGTECNIPPGRPSRRWKYNIKMDRKVRGWVGLDWIIWLRKNTSGRRL